MRGDSSTNMILFLTLLIAGMILATWYIQSVSPTRYVIGTVTNDIAQLHQHFTNACGTTIYNATYQFTTQQGFYMSNATHYCIYTTTFGTCKEFPCAAEQSRFDLSEGLIVHIEKTSASPVTIHP